MAAPGKWTLGQATDQIRACAAKEDFTPHWKAHALDRLLERDLIVADALHVLKHGFVLDEPVPSDVEGYFKYAVEAKTPNSDGRVVRLIVVPDGACELKVITIMWKDEQ
jgi:hypothetical protein